MIAKTQPGPRLSPGIVLRSLLQQLAAWGSRSRLPSPLPLHPVQRQIYTPSSWPTPLSADWYRPICPEPSPYIVVLIHGGGWKSGCPDGVEMTGLASMLAAQGINVIAPQYRLAPQWLHPSPLDDLHMLLDRLPELCAIRGLNIRSISLWGYSAGAHLASMLALQRPVAEISAVVAGGLPADLSLWPHSPIVANYLGVSAAQHPEQARNASPLYHIHPKAPPFFLYHGASDTLVEPTQALLMANELHRNGVATVCRMIPGYGHVACALHPASILADAINFLRNHFV